MDSTNFFISIKPPFKITHTFFKFSIASSNSSKTKTRVSSKIQKETLKILEWDTICSKVSSFTSTSMGRTQNVKIGQSFEESQKLLNQTTAALLLPKKLDFEGVEDIKEIVRSAGLGELMSVRELCEVKRTLGASRRVFEQLESVANDGGYSNRHSSLLEILQNCNFLTELEHKIGFCIDCNLSVILDRASEDLKNIRSERKKNMNNLESLSKEISTKIFQAGGIDTPLITIRRSRMCIGIRASHRSLLSDGVILNASSSGATYFMEPRDAVELNNMEVRLSNSEKSEELAVLKKLTFEIAESESEITYLLERITEMDLVSARAAYARWVHGVCPVIDKANSEYVRSSNSKISLSVDIEGMRHPVLLESSLRISSSAQASALDKENGSLHSRKLSGQSDLPVPIHIKIGSATKVVVISGPNTGGKTASMKTLGLASLMSKAGLYLPAKGRPRLPWFDLVLADIGDHQSLDQNLSTFSGHISRICKILELSSKESLVLIDEIGCGTDPSEGVALSASILQYLKNRVNLAVVTTHFADLSCLNEKDTRFENAAMEICLETLQPTYHILWGCSGDSNALTIAKSIGFDQKVLDRAHMWVGKLMPDKQLERKNMLYQSLLEERNTLETQARQSLSLHSEITKLYCEIQDEAEDLDRREAALKAMETQQVKQELKAAKAQIDGVVKNFENQVSSVSPDQFSILVKKSEAVISSIVEAHRPTGNIFVREADNSSYIPKVGEKVRVKGLGDKLATIVEAPGDDGMALVQYGKVKVRVNRNKLNSIQDISRRTKRNAATSTLTGLKGLVLDEHNSVRTLKINNDVDVQYGPVVQTSKNTVDIRGMRVEEASHQLSMVISASRSKAVLFVIHGMGTGVVKERVLELLENNPRIAKFEQESPMNYGCTVAYIK